MIKITQTSVNEIIVTLTEKVTLSSPYFLFQFENQQTKQLYYCISADTSSYTDRYNDFSIEEKTNPTLTNGEIRLANEGFYNYTIYEQESSTNLDPDNATGIVEKGICKVIGTARTSYSHTPATTTYVAHQS